MAKVRHLGLRIRAEVTIQGPGTLEANSTFPKVEGALTRLEVIIAYTSRK